MALSISSIGLAADNRPTPSPRQTAPSSGDADEGNSGRKGTFLGRLFSARPKESETAPGDKKPATASPGSKTDPKAEVKTEVKAEPKPVIKKPVVKEKPAEAPKTEQERFELARKNASEDPKISELRTKAEAHSNDAESARLMRAYLRSLYGKMRSLEPTLLERIDLTEAAALKLVPSPDSQ